MRRLMLTAAVTFLAIQQLSGHPPQQIVDLTDTIRIGLVREKRLGRR
jgi:hypothetical protein